MCNMHSFNISGCCSSTLECSASTSKLCGGGFFSEMAQGLFFTWITMPFILNLVSTVLFGFNCQDRDCNLWMLLTMSSSSARGTWWNTGRFQNNCRSWSVMNPQRFCKPLKSPHVSETYASFRKMTSGDVGGNTQNRFLVLFEPLTLLLSHNEGLHPLQMPVSS